MSYVYFQKMPTRQYGKNSKQGIHLKKPSAHALADALEVASRDGFTMIYVYDTSKTIVQIAEALQAETGMLIGWSCFCQTVEAFKLEYIA